MPTKQDLTLHEGNDERIAVTITPEEGGSLSSVTGLEFVLKPSTCESDDDDDALVLTSRSGGGVTITAQTSAQITAEVAIPGTALAETYERAWRLDALTAAARRTALYGSVTVVDL